MVCRINIDILREKNQKKSRRCFGWSILYYARWMIQNKESAMIEMDDAIRIVLENTRTIDTTRVGLGDVLGRVLAEEVRSDIDMPPFDKALMDGYALRGADIASASQTTPAILDVIEEIPAGNVPQKRVESGQASRIMTGAPMPEGADTVAMVEDTETDADMLTGRLPIRNGFYTTNAHARNGWCCRHMYCRV